MIGEQDRDLLIGQVAYLVDELRAQEAIVSFVPEPLWAATLPTGEHSLLELYGLLTALSERVYPALVGAWIEGGPGQVASTDEIELRDSEDWNASTPKRLILRTIEARDEIVRALEAMRAEAWNERRKVDGAPRTLADVAWRITQEDAMVLRRIGERLHEANLGATPIRRQ